MATHSSSGVSNTPVHALFNKKKSVHVCGNDASLQPPGRGLIVKDTAASFEVSVEARSCPGKHAQHMFTLRPVGFRDSLEVGVTYNCRCSCSAGLEPDSARCSGNGTYVCGLCECNPSYLGTRCECQEGESQSGYQNLCREAEGKPLCSGRGQCSCNQCSCFESEFGKIYGPFCECDNFSCARNKGVLCSECGREDKAQTCEANQNI
eukprot:bmy_20006T0